MSDWIAEQEDEPVIHLMSSAASRPALIPYLNVELTVAVYVGCVGAMLSLMADLGYGVIFTIVAFLFCRTVTAMDDQAFRIIGLVIKTQIVHFNWNWAFWKASCYTSEKTRF